VKEIQIHVWGGIGSQLHAYIFQQFLENKYKKIKFLMTLHEFRNYPYAFQSTKSDLQILFPDFKVNLLYKNYVSPSTHTFSRSRASQWFVNASHWFKRSVKLFDVTTWRPDRNSLERIPPLTRRIVGSYSDFSFHVSFYEKLLSNLHVSQIPHTVALHYRAGDLKEFGKESITINSVIATIESILIDHQIEKLILISEDSSIAKILIPSMNIEDVSILDTSSNVKVILEAGLSCAFFVGTNSKISLWIAMLRCVLGKQESTFLPQDQEVNFRNFSPQGVCYSLVFY
jgi:hypothetical protein